MGILKNLRLEFDSEIVDEFLEHYEVILDSIDLIVNDLSNPDYYKDNINELFRIFHNLKSAASFLKLEKFREFAKLVEDVLEIARQRDSANEELIDWLFKVVNMLEIWYNELINDEDKLSPINLEILNIPKGFK